MGGHSSKQKSTDSANPPKDKKIKRRKSKKETTPTNDNAEEVQIQVNGEAENGGSKSEEQVASSSDLDANCQEIKLDNDSASQSDSKCPEQTVVPAVETDSKCSGENLGDVTIHNQENVTVNDSDGKSSVKEEIFSTNNEKENASKNTLKEENDSKIELDKTKENEQCEDTKLQKNIQQDSMDILNKNDVTQSQNSSIIPEKHKEQSEVSSELPIECSQIKVEIPESSSKIEEQVNVEDKVEKDLSTINSSSVKNDTKMINESSEEIILKDAANESKTSLKTEDSPMKDNISTEKETLNAPKIKESNVTVVEELNKVEKENLTEFQETKQDLSENTNVLEKNLQEDLVVNKSEIACSKPEDSKETMVTKGQDSNLSTNDELLTTIINTEVQICTEITSDEPKVEDFVGTQNDPQNHPSDGNHQENVNIASEIPDIADQKDIELCKAQGDNLESTNALFQKTDDNLNTYSEGESIPCIELNRDFVMGCESLPIQEEEEEESVELTPGYDNKLAKSDDKIEKEPETSKLLAEETLQTENVNIESIDENFTQNNNENSFLQRCDNLPIQEEEENLDISPENEHLPVCEEQKYYNISIPENKNLYLPQEQAIVGNAIETNNSLDDIDVQQLPEPICSSVIQNEEEISCEASVIQEIPPCQEEVNTSSVQEIETACINEDNAIQQENIDIELPCPPDDGNLLEDLEEEYENLIPPPEKSEDTAEYDNESLSVSYEQDVTKTETDSVPPCKEQESTTTDYSENDILPPYEEEENLVNFENEFLPKDDEQESGHVTEDSLLCDSEITQEKNMKKTAEIYETENPQLFPEKENKEWQDISPELPPFDDKAMNIEDLTPLSISNDLNPDNMLSLKSTDTSQEFKEMSLENSNISDIFSPTENEDNIEISDGKIGNILDLESENAYIPPHTENTSNFNNESTDLCDDLLCSGETKLMDLPEPDSILLLDNIDPLKTNEILNLDDTQPVEPFNVNISYSDDLVNSFKISEDSILTANRCPDSYTDINESGNSILVDFSNEDAPTKETFPILSPTNVTLNSNINNYTDDINYLLSSENAHSNNIEPDNIEYNILLKEENEIPNKDVGILKDEKIQSEKQKKAFCSGDIGQILQCSSAVTFSWEDGGKEVSVSGTFNEWCEPITLNKVDGVFSLSKHIPDGEHYYKYLVDGTWTTSTKQPTTELDGHGQVNVLIVKTTEQKSE